MRVLLLTQWFDPEPTFKGIAFARELHRQGFEVEVLTGFPNYPGENISRVQDEPVGQKSHRWRYRYAGAFIRQP
jgi:hypothetical protein